MSPKGSLPPMYQKTVLPNGVRVITEQAPHFHSVSVGLWVNTGSRDETREENGLAHFLEHMAFKGTKRRSTYELAREIDQLGGTSNAFTSKENTCFYGKVLAEQLPRLIDLLSDMLLNPLYQAEDIDKERQVVLQEIHTQEDSPDEYVHVLFGRDLWGETPFGRPITGSVETVSRFTRPVLVHYRQETYRPERLVIAAAGQLRHKEFVDLVNPYFGNFSNGSPARSRDGISTQAGVHFYPRDLEQVHLCFGTPAPAAGDPARYVAMLLNLILGGNMSSRLFQEIRENRGLCYSIYSSLSSFSDAGLLAITAAVSPENLFALVEAIRIELEKLRKREVSAEELQGAQEYLRRALYLSAEDSDNRMIRLAKNEINLGRHVSLQEIIANLEAVTPAQINHLAQEVFCLPKWTLVFLGPVVEHAVPWEVE